MLSATEVKSCTLNNTTVEAEISLINLNILSVTNNNTVVVDMATTTEIIGTNVTVTGTPMTIANVYYDTWQNITPNVFKTNEMQKVIDYYTKLGYTINRKSEDSEHLYWQITW